jgi:CheY-like chemotaxis protein
MANAEVLKVAKLAVKTGLVTESQVQEAWKECAKEGDKPDVLLKALERKGFLTPWQSQKLLKGEVDGYILGGYRLQYLISSGSFGRVYRAEDPQSGQMVAIKVLRKKWSEDVKSIELFEREAKVGQSLVHANIVQIMAVNRDVATQQYYMVMEFVEGGTLKDFLAVRKKLEPTEALRLIEDAATGLAFAHSKGMSHRDIKLTNILISSQGVAKLVDFGLAGIQATQAASKEGAEAKVQRTVDYAGLEKATNVKPGDIRSDIFFLGCVLYEMLSGRPPLEATKDAHARMQRRRYESIPGLNAEEVKAPQSLFQLVNTMIAFDPPQRYQTPAVLVEAIKQVRADLEGRSIAGPVGGGPRSIFVVQPHEKLRETIRDRLKELGYRVMVAGDPNRALERFAAQPFHALVLDAGTAGEEGMLIFQQVMSDAEARGLPTAGLLILSEKQADWQDRLFKRLNQAVLIRPVALKQLEDKILSMVPLPKKYDA